MLHALMEAAPYLAAFVVGVALLALAGLQPDADEHDLSDYHEPAPVNDAPRSLRRYEVLDRKTDVDILPPAPPGMNAGSPLYAGMLFDTWHPETPEAVARKVLRDLGEKARAKYADRDLTGAFPVVRAA